MNDVGGRQLMGFKTWRKSETDLETVSLNGNLAILQRFLRFCENIDRLRLPKDRTAPQSCGFGGNLFPTNDGRCIRPVTGITSPRGSTGRH